MGFWKRLFGRGKQETPFILATYTWTNACEDNKQPTAFYLEKDVPKQIKRVLPMALKFFDEKLELIPEGRVEWGRLNTEWKKWKAKPENAEEGISYKTNCHNLIQALKFYFPGSLRRVKIQRNHEPYHYYYGIMLK